MKIDYVQIGRLRFTPLQLPDDCVPQCGKCSTVYSEDDVVIALGLCEEGLIVVTDPEMRCPYCNKNSLPKIFASKDAAFDWIIDLGRSVEKLEQGNVSYCLCNFVKATKENITAH